MGAPKDSKDGYFAFPANFADMSPEARTKYAFEASAGTRPDRFTHPMVRDGMKLDKMERTSPTTAKATFTFLVTPFYCNSSGNLHGGAQATLFDIATSAALAPLAKPGMFMYFGVSRRLSVTYLRPVRAGEKLICESEVMSIGKRFASIRAVLRRDRDGAIISTCEHDTLNADPDVGAKI